MLGHGVNDSQNGKTPQFKASRPCMDFKELAPLTYLQEAQVCGLRKAVQIEIF